MYTTAAIVSHLTISVVWMPHVPQHDMTTARIAIDPLWQCLCPLWAQRGLRRTTLLSSRRYGRTQAHCANLTTALSVPCHARAVPNSRQPDAAYGLNKRRSVGTFSRQPTKSSAGAERQHWAHETTPAIYGRLTSAAIHGEVRKCQECAEHLVRVRHEKPNLLLYNALILCNLSADEGTALRVHQLLEEMRSEGLPPDIGTCHAVLKVVSVHLDHLLRSDVLEYMQRRWYVLSEDGAHDVAAGLFREGLFEQALARIDEMRRDNMRVEIWLLDMAVYMLCEAGEIEEAYRIMLLRYDSGELNISRNTWAFLLDKGSEAFHHAASALAWSSQVRHGYLNPSSGTCLNVLTAAARVGDATLATDVFTHLSKRSTNFQPIHYSLLISAYLATSPPDLKRALSVLTIMTLEKLEPSTSETRELYTFLRASPDLVAEALSYLRQLSSEGRQIPIAAVNVLIECCVQQRNLEAAMKIYKIIHTLTPLSQGVQKSFADAETFNLLLKGCRLQLPPDVAQAAFLIAELRELRVKPNAITYDRLVLVFLDAAKAARLSSTAAEHAEHADSVHGAQRLADAAFRYFEDMQALDLLPRFGTLELLAVELAALRDARCWDVLQFGDDRGREIEGFAQKGRWVRARLEEIWESGGGAGAGSLEGRAKIDEPESGHALASTVHANS